MLKCFLCWFSIFLFLPHAVEAQSVTESELLLRIKNQQAEKNQSPIGVLPAYISRKQVMKTKKRDANIFYNQLLIYTLAKAAPALSQSNQALTDSIFREAQVHFPKFENKKGRGTYNFWRTDSSYSFPYMRWVELVHKEFAPPDDLDVTSLAFMVLNKDSVSSSAVHRLMQDYTHDGKQSRSVEKKYLSYPFYSSWFGKKFPVVLDVCVLANVLCLVQTKHLRWTKADSASLKLIVASIANRDIVNRPMQVSPYYGKTSIILYHLARLMAISKVRELESVKPVLKEMALQEFAQSTEPLEKVIIGSTLMKWGYDSPVLEIPTSTQVEEVIEKSNFPFFIGNVPSFLSRGKRNLLAKLKIGLFYHYCPAFNDALLLEYIVLKNAASLN